MTPLLCAAAVIFIEKPDTVSRTEEEALWGKSVRLLPI